MAKCVLHIRRNCYFWGFGKVLISPLELAYIRGSILKANNLVTKWRFQVSFTKQIQNLPYFCFRSIWADDLERVSHSAFRAGIVFTKFEVGQPACPFLICNVFTADTLRPSATLTFDPWTLNVCNVTAVTAVTCSNYVPNVSEIEQPAMSYCHCNISNLGAVRYLEFNRKWIFNISRLRTAILHHPT